jgi:hypothetical protein
MPACQGVKDDGSACMIDPRFVDDESGYCMAHDPEKGTKRMSELGRLGQEAIQRKAAAKGITEEELGPLETLDDAKRWLEVIGKAVAQGRLSDRAGGTVVRAVSEWVKAFESGTSAEMYQSLKKKLAHLEGEAATRGRGLKVAR